MNAYLPESATELWSIAGWTMVHFLWMGALVGAAAAVCRLLLRRVIANLRYVVTMAWLAVLMALPVGIAGWMARAGGTLSAESAVVAATDTTARDSVLEPAAAPAAEEIIELHRLEEDAAIDGGMTNEIVADSAIDGTAAGLKTADVVSDREANPRQSRGLSRAAAGSVLGDAAGGLNAWVAHLPWVWLVGTPITFGLLLTGVIGGRRLRRASRLVEDGPIAEILARLMESLHVTRRVTVGVCERIAAPVLIGIVRPMILLPPSALTGWSPDEIEMVLLHELAHVRRWDNLVNLLQRLVESLLFFHPAVWMVSGWVRREREACCDAVVVWRTNRPQAYAEMLVALAAQMPRSVLFHPAASSAMAAGPLRSRIRRILQLEDDPMLVSGKSLTIVLGSLLVAATLAVLYVPAMGQPEQATTKGNVDTVSANTAAPSDKPHAEQAATIDAASGTPSVKPSVFPSLADQKLFDLAFKRLNVELESIGSEDLKRVQALGYEGGVKVVQGNQNLQWNDILVGLHVWPTTSIKDVATILERDDLAELNPLKFYVIRQEGATSPEKPNGVKDFVRSGRISVQLENRSRGRGWGGDPFNAAPTKAPAAAVAPKVEASNPFAAPATNVPAQQSGGAAERQTPTAAPERIVAVYNVPKVLANQAERMIKNADGRWFWDDQRRFVVQATKETHEYFSRNLAATPKWRAPAAARDRSGRPIDVKTVDGHTILEWRTMGLTLEEQANPQFKAGSVVVVTEVDQGSPAAWYDLRLGDHIVSLMSFDVSSVAETRSVLESLLNSFKGKEAEVHINTRRFQPNGKTYTRVTVTLPLHPDAVETTWGSEGWSPPADTAPSTYIEPPAESYSRPAEPVAAVPRVASSDPLPATNERSVVVYPASPVALPAGPPTTAPVKELQKPTMPAGPPRVPVPAIAPAPTPEEKKGLLRYDGKTFATWRDTWQTELSTDKRLEAIKALSAFGRAGYGKEAVEAILDVAGEYDFRILEGTNSPEGRLKETVLEELTPEYRTQALAPYWVVGLSERYGKNPKQWKWLTIMLFSRLKTDDPDTLGILRSFVASDDSQLRQESLGALLRLSRGDKEAPSLDEATRKLVESALESGDTNLVLSTLWQLVYYPQTGMAGGMVGGDSQGKLLYRPHALGKLLFHGDKDVRLRARRLLTYLDENDAADLAPELALVMKDKARGKDRIEAIRALAAMGTKGKDAISQLVEVLLSSDDLPTRDAAMVALIRCSGKQADSGNLPSFYNAIDQALAERTSQEERKQIMDEFNAPREELGSGEERMQRLADENSAVLPPQTQHLGGGGFF